MKESLLERPPERGVSHYNCRMALLLEVSALSVELPTAAGRIRPVNEVSFAVQAGETLGIVGESGSGKTMLALALMGLLPAGARRGGEALYVPQNIAGVMHSRPKPSLEMRAASALASGTNRFTLLNLAGLREFEWREVRGAEIAMIFQEPMTALNPVMRVSSQIGEAIRAHEPRLDSLEVERRTREALERAAVPEPELRARQFPHQLSGGLRQRAMIAMALAAGPRLLIADEPTTALDVTVQKQILDLLARLRRELGLTLVFITHDLAVVGQIADRLAVMYAGRIVEEGPSNEVLRRPRHPYTEGLLRASPQLRRQKLEPIPGMVPRLDALPPGCAFEPRCPVRRAECSAAVPEPRAAGPGHHARCILV
jgi:oligopeptide/dipeptide ABC transporter ATP-binding protein